MVRLRRILDDPLDGFISYLSACMISRKKYKDLAASGDMESADGLERWLHPE